MRRTRNCSKPDGESFSRHIDPSADQLHASSAMLTAFEMIYMPSSTPASSIHSGGATKIQFQRTKVNRPTIRRTALNICKLDPTPKMGVSRKRLAAALSEESLDHLLGIKTR